MRVLFLSSYVDPGAGSGILLRLAEKMKREGHEVMIVTTKAGKTSGLVRSVDCSKVFRMASEALNRFVPHYFSLQYSALLREVVNYKPDVINVHWTHGTTIPASLVSYLSYRWPLFWTIHDQWPITLNSFFEDASGEVLVRKKRTFYSRLKDSVKFSPKVLYRYKQNLFNHKRINTISPSMWLQRKVSDSPVFRDANNYHIANGVDIATYRPLDKIALRDQYGVPSDKNVVLFLSANLADERKGFYYFVKSLEQIQQKEPEFARNILVLLVGDHSETANSFIPMEVMAVGRTTSPNKIAQYYNLADLFVSASIADNFPSTLLESLACGTPIVSFDVGGVPEIVLDGETGFLVENKDVTSMADRIVEVLVDKELRERMGVASRGCAEKNYSMDVFSKAYVDLFFRGLD